MWSKSFPFTPFFDEATENRCIRKLTGVSGLFGVLRGPSRGNENRGRIMLMMLNKRFARPDMGETSISETRSANPDVVLPRTIYPVEPEPDEELAIEQDVMTHNKEATGISKEVYREMLMGAAEAGRGHVRYWNLLVDTVEKSGYRPPVGRDTIILDIGCGVADEARSLNSFFGGKDISERSKRTKVIGIDISEERIHEAKKRHIPIFEDDGSLSNTLPPYFEFLHADAAQLDQIPEVPDVVDVVVMRHPQFVGEPDIDREEEYKKWAAILKQSLDKLSETGIIFVTTHNEVDRDLVRKAANELHCKVTVDEENKWSRDLEESDNALSLDKYVITIMK